MSIKILISPSRYVQGPGALKFLGEQIKHLGQKAFVIGGKTAISQTQDIIKKSLEEQNISFKFETFRGECCDSEINRLKEIAVSEKCDVVVSVGGGKVIDTGKALSAILKLPIVIAPTIAATDAPCSALSVIYTEDGVFDRYFILPKNPDLVLLDTEIIAKAPARFLVSGMGDALATWFEANSCYQSASKNIPGGYSTVTALKLARLCYELLIEYGEQAKIAVEKGVVTPAVEKIIEANTLLSGIGFESSGLAAAHAVHDGFTILEETHKMYHGEKVAFGTLVHLVLEDHPWAEIKEVLDFCVKVGLPITLKQIGIENPDPEKIMQVAKKTCEPGMMIHNMPFPVTPEMVYNAIFAADAIGTKYLNKEL
ncbi:MAG: glycerol dehydrogenase [Thermovenabulum sp.]|uniref:glycerol dehydrogenase n=1 Tax=Thermovenabulum sp. TaxID=3100335 RepID=UPI003C7D69D5